MYSISDSRSDQPSFIQILWLRRACDTSSLKMNHTADIAHSLIVADSRLAVAVSPLKPETVSGGEE